MATLYLLPLVNVCMLAIEFSSMEMKFSYLYIYIYLFIYIYIYIYIYMGARGDSCLRHCATSQKVTGSIPDGFTGIFH